MKVIDDNDPSTWITIPEWMALYIHTQCQAARAQVREQITRDIESLQTWTDESGAVVVFKSHALGAIRGERGGL